jgi:hypothetical protein
VTDLFPGEARPLPEWTGPGWTISFGPDVPPPPPPVTHAEGYEPFVAFALAAGTQPAALAADVDAFSAFVRGHADAFAEPALMRAAAVFIGNALVVLHPGATWRATQEPEVGTDGMSVTVDRVVPALVGMPEEADLRRLLATWDAEDARHDAVDAAIDAAERTTAAVRGRGTPDFVRPSMAVGPFLDEDGEVIPYGDRWADRDRTPPDDAYERVSHPERFAPLHALADALLAHLVARFDVEATAWRDGHGDRVVDLRPTEGAPIRITWSAFPGLHVRAGLLATHDAPSCGCDACDETAESEADGVEEAVLAVVEGRFTERLPSAPRTGAYSLGGGASGGLDLPPVDDRLVRPDVVAALDGRAWPAWPLRD